MSTARPGTPATEDDAQRGRVCSGGDTGSGDAGPGRRTAAETIGLPLAPASGKCLGALRSLRPEPATGEAKMSWWYNTRHLPPPTRGWKPGHGQP
jgi:hypothetical protein